VNVNVSVERPRPRTGLLPAPRRDPQTYRAGVFSSIRGVPGLQRAVGNRAVNLLIQGRASIPGRDVLSLDRSGEATLVQSVAPLLGTVQRSNLQRADPLPVAGQPPDTTGGVSLGVDEHGNPSVHVDTGGPGELRFPPDKDTSSGPTKSQSPTQPPVIPPIPDRSQACPGRFNPLTGLCCRDDQVFNSALGCTCPDGQLEQLGVCAAPPASDASPGPGDYNVPDPNAPTQMG
jgi:hypothetical protein